ncbi:MAG: DUF58 domain-containing protein [Burkholderiaceae bacterium]
MFNPLRSFFRKRLDKWLFQLGDVESGETFLSQRRVFIVPSKAGLAFVCMLVILYIGSLNYNLNLGYGLTFLIAGCALIDMHLTFRNLAHLYLAAGRASPVFAGENAQFELHLINRRKHDRYAIWLGFIGEGLPDLSVAADVPANAKHSVTLSAPTHERGWLTAPRVRLHTYFPLGLLRAWSYWKPDAKVLVYPMPEENTPPLPMEGADKEDGHGSAGHDDFAGVRPYQSGDSMKRLAWRQIARVDLDAGGALITKHFEGGVASDLTLDFAKLPQRMPVETKLSRMTRWVLDAEALGLPYAFRLGALSFPASMGPAHQSACLRALALYEGI